MTTLGASAAPNVTGWPLVIVAGGDEGSATATGSGTRPVRHACSPIPPPTTTATSAASTASRIHRSRRRAAACSAWLTGARPG